MPKKILALKITPQTYQIYLNYPGIEHFDLNKINNTFLVRDETLEDGHGYFSKLDFDKYYKATRSPLFFRKFTPCIRVPVPVSEQEEVVPPKRIRE